MTPVFKTSLLTLLLAWPGGEQWMTFEEALNLGWQSSPVVIQAQLAVASAEGAHQVERSAFDGRFDFDLSLDYSRLELTPTVYDALVTQRANLELTVAELNSTADDLEAQIEESDSRLLVECSEDLIIFIDDQPICDTVSNLEIQAFDDLLVNLVGDIGLDADLLADIGNTSNESLAEARQAVLETIAVLRSAADDTQESRDLLGDTPLLSSFFDLFFPIFNLYLYNHSLALTLIIFLRDALMTLLSVLLFFAFMVALSIRPWHQFIRP